MQHPHQIGIVGAGPAGLYLSAFLTKHKIPHLIFDQTNELTSIGFAVIMQDSMLSALAEIGLTKDDVGIVDSRTMEIIRDDKVVIDTIHVKDTPVHSGTRYGVLNAIKSKVDESALIVRKQLKNVEKEGDDYVLTFADGSIFRVAHLIGADGIRSAVRESLFVKNAIRTVYSALYLWVCNQARHSIKAYPSSGLTTLVIPTNEEESVLYLATDKRLDVKNKTAVQLARELLLNAGKAERELAEKIDDTKPTLVTLVRRTKQFRFIKGRAALIGDAAHGETPILGWGTTIAIEDAYVLGKQIVTHQTNIKKAFRNYYALRKKRVSVLHALTTLEETIFGLMPKSTNEFRVIVFHLIKPCMSLLYNHTRRLYKKLFTYKLE